jgi:phosphopantothenoylcysteine decarboxylase/phosphopantothenate--cysteine ligase
MTLLAGKRILLGVSGGIAAYKSPELVRRLQDAGAEVRVIVTAAGARFVSPLALEIVSGHPVGLDLWEPLAEPLAASFRPASRIAHTDLGKDSDLIILAPATADLIGKIRHGLADDLLSTTVMASRTPVLICPAMNTEMLENPLVAANIAALAAIPRYRLLEPGVGLLACGVHGPGRQPDPPDIIEAAAAALAPQDLTGLRAVVSAGPTCEPIDPVRFLGNRSTGTMGFAIARALGARGAQVTLVAGPVHQRTPVGVARRLDVETAHELHGAIDALWPDTDLLVMTAAVADFRPSTRHTHKLKKGAGAPPILELERTVDVLATMAEKPDRRRVTLVGFAAETEDVISYARAKRAAKDLDWIVANDVGASGVGFGRGENAGWLIGRDDHALTLARAPKDRFAESIVAHLAPHLAPHAPGAEGRGGRR